MAFTISMLFSTFTIILYIKVEDPLPNVFISIQNESFYLEEIWNLFKYQVLIGFMTWADLIYSDILKLMVAKLRITELAGYTIGLMIYRFLTPFSLSMGVTVLSYTGSAMGEGNILRSKRVIISLQSQRK